MRNKRALWAILAGVAIAAQASAQAVPDARPSWIDDGRQLPQPKLTDIGIPRTIGLLTLKQLTDFGSARDAVAQYLSDDGQIEATIYLYENNAAHKSDDIVFRTRDAAGRLLPKECASGSL